VNHKNELGKKTYLITTEEIYVTYNGIDKAEQIKYCIKDYIERYNIKYVLLVGGLKKFINCNPENEDNWHVPARYSYLDLDGFPESKYLCDLYFADIYYNNTNIFCSWNNAPNGDPLKFGEWKWDGGEEIKDERDLIPDVAVGRLPCRNKYEVAIMVKKIITYESDYHREKDWFDRILLIGGDTLNDDDGAIEGKDCTWISYLACKHLHGTNITLWPDENDPTNTNLRAEVFIKEQNKGSGITIFSGHGDSGAWFNHQYYKNFQKWEYIRAYRLLFLTNKGKHPVVVIGGCNTATFDKDNSSFARYFTIECFSWIYTMWPFGGSIATIGNTAICSGIGGYDYSNYYNGYLITRFFEIYGKGEYIIGDICKKLITNYIGDFPTTPDNVIHTKSLENWILFGDPSLMIGGYEDKRL
jgi:hypothetical protein